MTPTATSTPTRTATAANVHTRDIANSAALMAEPARISMLIRLLNGCSLPATDLAREAGVAASTASEHLARLVDGGLLLVEPRGRHRYYRLSGADVAHAIEAISAIAPIAPKTRDVAAAGMPAIRQARTCYDHLAGVAGVGVTTSLIRRRFINLDGRDFALTSRGEAWFRDFGVDPDFARQKKRHFARACLDWTERRDHLAGALGSALAERMFELGWLKRVPEGRWLRVTVAGREALAREFGIELAPTSIR